jgi:hypothetical protein
LKALITAFSFLHFPKVASGLRTVVEKLADDGVPCQIRAGFGRNASGDERLRDLRWIVEETAKAGNAVTIPGASLNRAPERRFRGTDDQGACGGGVLVPAFLEYPALRPFVKALDPLEGSLVHPNVQATNTWAIYKSNNFSPTHIDSVDHGPASTY